MTSEDFDWTGSDVVIRSYGDIAVYPNGHGDIVIRQQSNHDDDRIVIVPRAEWKTFQDALAAALADADSSPRE